MSEEEVSSCARNVLGHQDSHQSLRIAAIFIILASSSIGAFFPLIAKQSLRLPVAVYESVSSLLAQRYARSLC
jgi:hypothetical protein